MIRYTPQVAALLEYALADPDAVPGRRLKSERDLAIMLGVGRRQVNEALSQLSHRGLLSRTRGSGTYVLRRAKPSESRAVQLRDAWEQGMLDDPTDVFTATGTAGLAGQAPGTLLRLCLCGDWLDASPVHHAVVERMIATVQRYGHQLSIVSVLDEAGRPLLNNVLRQRLRASPADGYLVVDRWGEVFLHAAESVPAPVVFCGNICGMRHEPAIGVCQYDVTPRALKRLAEAGYTRIAMLGYHHPSNSIEVQQDAYDNAMLSLGLDYRRCELIRLGDLRSGAAVRRLLRASPVRPDAIYLSDEFLAPALVEAAEDLQIVFGRDMGLVCFTNRGISDLPTSWSRFEVDVRLAGQYAVEALLQMIESGEEYASNVLLQPRWHPRQTHSPAAAADAAVPSQRRENAQMAHPAS